MSRKKKTQMPELTRSKMIRLLIFVILTVVGFTLNKYVPAVRTFGWGYTFGMLCMVVLTG